MGDLPELRVLHEDNHLLAVCKPAGMLVQADRTGDVSLLERTREWIRIKYRKPGDVYCGLVHRLDRPVSGVLLFAKTSKAAGRLCDQFRTHSPRKEYCAVVLGGPPKKSDRLVHHLLPGRKENRKSRVVAEAGTGTQESALRYEVLRTDGSVSELGISLETGRKHQIRAQLSHIGCPIVGDLKYGAPDPIAGGRAIALHAEALTVTHPTRREAVTVRAELPDYWPIRSG